MLITIWCLQKLGKYWQFVCSTEDWCNKFNLRKLSELNVRKRYQNKISNTFAALENLNDNEDINRLRKTLKKVNQNFS